MSGSFQFIGCKLISDKRVLMRGETPLSIGSRAFDLLLAFVSRAGDLLTKEELIQAAWPRTVVDEANLRVHITALRKLLGETPGGRSNIINEPGRGYRFVAPVVRLDAKETPAGATALPNAASVSRGSRASAIFGRDHVITTVAAKLDQWPLVTLVGPGGIGKTTVALAVAERMSHSLTDGTCFVDFAPLSDGALSASTMANALGVTVGNQNPTAALCAFLRDRQMLIVLDNCERIADGVAPLVETLMMAAPNARFLATSREPLRVREERLYRLGSLDYPEAGTSLEASEALDYSAIRLFVERASASLDHFKLADEDAAIVSCICRKLDGLPLAIELAAGRVAAFGLRGVANLIDKNMQLSTPLRTAAPRHRTLTATLDWSYETLQPIERAVFRRFSIFVGRFSFEAARAVAGQLNVELAAVIASLVEKSLVVADVSGETASYRLLDTTRFYGLQKLADEGELDQTALQHASYQADHLENTALKLRDRLDLWRLHHRQEIDDVRAALDWAFSPKGDSPLGVRLTIAAIPLLNSLLIGDETCARVSTALLRVGGSEVESALLRMRLLTSLGGGSLIHAGAGTLGDEQFWRQALNVTDQSRDSDLQLRAIYGLYVLRMHIDDYKGALNVAGLFVEKAKHSSVSSDVYVGERTMAFALHHLGEQEEARLLLERVLAHCHPSPEHAARFMFDQRAMAHGTLAKCLWLLGMPDQAKKSLQNALNELSGGLGSLTLPFVVAQAACPLAFFTGDYKSASRYIEVLLDQPAALWKSWGQGFRGVLLVRQGKVAEGLEILAETARERPANISRMYHNFFVCEYAQALARVSDLEQAQKKIEEAITFSSDTGQTWSLPELLRVEGEFYRSADQASRAWDCFQDSLSWARRQKTLSWELRTATSVARLLVAQEKPAQALDALVPIYERFKEGRETADLIAARDLIMQVGHISPHRRTLDLRLVGS